VLERFEGTSKHCSECAHGEVHLVRRVAGYKKIRYYTHENVGYGNVNLPDQELHTTCVWWQTAPAALDEAFRSRWEALDGFLGAAYAMHFVAAVLSMAERQDLGRAVGNGDASWCSVVGSNGRGQAKGMGGEEIDLNASGSVFSPTVFLYDNYPGGIGLSAPLYDMRDRVVETAREMIQSCRCEFGCPACIGPILASEENSQISPKSLALTILDLLQSVSPERW
jgi:DEAD/DEAH box helicase domain-containing protein